MGTLKGKIALVTGGNSGIGYAAAKELKQQGATVIITGRRKEALENATATLGVTGFVSDQGNVKDVEQLAEQVNNTFGNCQEKCCLLYPHVVFPKPIWPSWHHRGRGVFSL
jgi:NAD(P)-dependent dehydrogenase (short-subunit alcohol dehydrogenase family)